MWTGINSAGCDSTATLNLTIDMPTISTLTISACDSYFWNGTTYNASGTYVWNGTNAVGCDSSATLVLTVNNTPQPPTITAAGSTSICEGDSVALTASSQTGLMWSTLETVKLI